MMEEKKKARFEMLVLLMFVLLIFGLGWINVPLGYHVIRKIRKSNGALRGLALAYFFFVMGWIFILGIIFYFVLKLFHGNL